MFFILLLSFARFSAAVPIDNGLTEEPEINCGPDRIGISFITKNNFEGTVFVKSRFEEEGCRNTFSAQDRSPSIELQFDQCGVRRARSLNPKGVFVSVSVIISFHPKFVTKIDRAFLFQCFYMEAEKTVTTLLEVSMLTTDFRTLTVPMPICRYEILEEDAEGESVRFALVGDKVYHKWTCDTETVDTFCMIVHSCFVDDTQGRKFMILDEEGCALDKYILGNIEYLSDLMAGKEVHVYKFADRGNLYYDCQIKITVKEPNSPCKTPSCEEPRRGKRSTKQPCTDGFCLDVAAQIATVQANTNITRANKLKQKPDEEERHCFTFVHLGAGLSGLAVLAMILSISIIIAMYRWKRRMVVLVFREQQQQPPVEPARTPPPLPRKQQPQLPNAVPPKHISTANRKPITNF